MLPSNYDHDLQLRSHLSQPVVDLARPARWAWGYDERMQLIAVRSPRGRVQRFSLAPVVQWYEGPSANRELQQL